MADDRAEFNEARLHGLKARHETRVERAREREAETLAAEVEPWLRECGSCDAALPMSCTCPPGDYRVVLLKVWQAYEASRVTVAKEIEQACERDAIYDTAARFHFARIAREIGTRETS